MSTILGACETNAAKSGRCSAPLIHLSFNINELVPIQVRAHIMRAFKDGSISQPYGGHVSHGHENMGTNSAGFGRVTRIPIGERLNLRKGQISVCKRRTYYFFAIADHPRLGVYWSSCQDCLVGSLVALQALQHQTPFQAQSNQGH